ncbi:DICT sensory domain-containing protein [Pleurocapsa sp. PCC 7319]|uniref:DICT sensory domain-containing protein n=1 Tax=Pleurocapsa sp. PCC 7319 TaxID=118161 RepID=UPI000345C3E5|nr:DICT sensory domain-containing protein [Pleurocapsa sp. PCC 7319]
MYLTNSLLGDLVTEHPNLRCQIYFKSSLTALTRAMQDLVLADNEKYLVIANFQQEKFFNQQAGRFQRMAQKSDHVYILGVPNPESSFAVANSGYETIPLQPTDTLAGERYLVIIGQQYSACLAVRDRLSITDLRNASSVVEQGERFEGVWSFDRDIAYTAADWLLGMIANYRPELKDKTLQARHLFKLGHELDNKSLRATRSHSIDLGIFSQRLVTYLQAGQYKLLKAYKSIATAERKEYLINRIAAAQRSSFNPQEILKTTVKELGQLFPDCRCLLYRLDPNDTEVQIEYEYKPLSMKSLVGQQWSIATNPLFIAAQAQKSTLAIEDVSNNPYLNENPVIKDKIVRAGIHSWLMVSIRYQGQLLGMLELHYGGDRNFQWKAEDISLVEAVTVSAGAALTQASAYTNLVELNTQLEAVERIQSNLIAIVGHELRTPLSTIRICLESLATEPDMPMEFKNTMLDTALGDTERLGQLIQNFLTLSRLEAGKAYRNIRNIESLTIDYALNLALRNIQKNSQVKTIPEIRVELPHHLPSIMADIDGLVEVFTKLLDNACKFTPSYGEIVITARIKDAKYTIVPPETRQELEIIITDTGCGIDQSELEIIFDRFSQSESYLRRTVSGVGLGLVICRKIIQGMGGQIWAYSEGKNKGSQFHFTLPIESQSPTDIL